MTKSNMPTYLGAAMVSALLGGFGLLADEVVEGDTLNFDKSILLSLREPGYPSNPLGPAWLEEAGRDITALGSFSVLTILVIAIATHLFISRKARTAWYLIVAVVGGTIISTVLKSLFDRPRPALAAVARVFTASFPSGHATVSAVVYLTLGALLAEITPLRSLKVFYVAVAIILTLIIGVSRVYLGVHYPTDVVAGWSIGGAWALICVIVWHVLPTRRPAVSVGLAS